MRPADRSATRTAFRRRESTDAVPTPARRRADEPTSRLVRRAAERQRSLGHWLALADCGDAVRVRGPNLRRGCATSWCAGGAAVARCPTAGSPAPAAAAGTVRQQWWREWAASVRLVPRGGLPASVTVPNPPSPRARSRTGSSAPVRASSSDQLHRRAPTRVRTAGARRAVLPRPAVVRAPAWSPRGWWCRRPTGRPGATSQAAPATRPLARTAPARPRPEAAGAAPHAHPVRWQQQGSGRPARTFRTGVRSGRRTGQSAVPSPADPPRPLSIQTARQPRTSVGAAADPATLRAVGTLRRAASPGRCRAASGRTYPAARRDSWADDRVVQPWQPRSSPTGGGGVRVARLVRPWRTVGRRRPAGIAAFRVEPGRTSHRWERPDRQGGRLRS